MRNRDKPAFHLHQLHACARPQEQSLAVLPHQPVGTICKNIHSFPSGKFPILNTFQLEIHTFSSPRPCVNGALPVAISAASTCNKVKTTACSKSKKIYTSKQEVN
jgi:hypothetical protein